MKVEDLRIGDLVYCTYWPEKRIVRVYELKRNFNDKLMVVVMDEIPCTFPEKYIEPIPLTSEILEKNGWVYNDEDEKFFPQTWVGGGLMLQGANDCGYCIVVASDYDDEDTNRTPFILLYVHELQHALRLHRIDKEITL